MKIKYTGNVCYFDQKEKQNKSLADFEHFPDLLKTG